MILKRKSQTRKKSIQASSAFLKEHCFSASSCRSAKWLLLEKNFLRMKPLPDWLLKTNGCCQSISTISFLVWTIHHIRNAPRKENLTIKIPSPRSASRYRLLQIRKKGLMYWTRRKQSVLNTYRKHQTLLHGSRRLSAAYYRAFKTLSELCMTKKPMPINESDYDEKKRPFDDVIRQILKAKPTHRNTDKLKGRLKKKKKG